MDSLKAPKIYHFIDWMSRLDYGSGRNTPTYDEKAYELLDELYQELRKIKPIGDRSRRELWLRAERGTLEDWGNLKEMVEDGEFDSEEEAIAYWQDIYPEEEYWYHLLSIEDEDGFRGLFLEHKYIIEVDPEAPRYISHYNISALVAWMLSEVRRCIQELEDGVYNENVERELPPQYRFGTIVRKALYDIFPDEREEYFQDLTPEDREAFVALGTEKPSKKRIATMTANDFYTFCAYGYAANDYEGTELPAKEQYCRHADGRDEGLHEIDPDSPEAFLEWLTNRKQRGGHPWEVCRGGNSTHVALYVCHDNGGYYLCLAGSSWGRTIETVKFYLALHRRGLPVYVREATALVERLLETEKIGIVPSSILPVYCGGYFPDEHIISFRHLPEEKLDEVLKHCVWQKCREVNLA